MGDERALLVQLRGAHVFWAHRGLRVPIARQAARASAAARASPARPRAGGADDHWTRGASQSHLNVVRKIGPAKQREKTRRPPTRASRTINLLLPRFYSHPFVG